MMMKRILFFVLFLFYFHNILLSQDSIVFNRLYDKTKDETAQKDLDEALKAADTLYRMSEKPLYKIRSLILTARLYQQKEDLAMTLEYAQKAEKLAEEIGDYDWQVRSIGLIAGQYRMMELYQKAKQYVEKAMQIIPKIKDQNKANSTSGLMQQELALTNMDQGNPKQAIVHLIKANDYFHHVKNNTYYLINNDRLLGDNYYDIGQYNTALKYYHEALKFSKEFPVNYVTGMIQKGLAETYLALGQLDKAKVHIEEAEKIGDESQYLQIKNAILDASKRFYAKIKDTTKFVEAREKKDSVVDLLLDKRASLLDTNYAKLDQKEIILENKVKRSNKTLVIFLILFLGTLVGVIIYFIKKRKKDLVKYKLIMEQLAHAKNRTVLPAEEAVTPLATSKVEEKKEAEPINTKIKNTDQSYIRPETEQKLISKLNEFEKEHLYLDKNVSLSSLAASFETNNKYLSNVIKQYKHMDYNTYINELRIKYIILKLTENPEWRQYKMSFLAETAGFSSHSQFASIFKALKGISPSVFVRFLDSEEE